tara:strand:- start:4200 stop:4949 length:750 start_codon:yes stop_codon:yes gene_type:complete
MIKFFRKIRQNLLMENKTSKYFKYAIGEIILVVIGILIALQINNWNENKKQEITTKNYLEALKIELVGNSKKMELISKRARRDLKIAVKLLKDLNNESVRIDNEYMNHTGLIPIFKYELGNSVLLDIVSSGALDNLPNKDLKRKILSVNQIYQGYDKGYLNAKDTWDDYMLPYLNKHMNVTNLWDSLSVVKMPKLKYKNNLMAFVNNKTFANILSSRMRMLANIDNNMARSKPKIEGLIVDIEKYLTND